MASLSAASIAGAYASALAVIRTLLALQAGQAGSLIQVVPLFDSFEGKLLPATIGMLIPFFG